MSKQTVMVDRRTREVLIEQIDRYDEMGFPDMNGEYDEMGFPLPIL